MSIKLNPTMSTCHPDKPLQARGLCKNCYNKWLILHNPDYADRQKKNTDVWIRRNSAKHKEYQKDYSSKLDPSVKKNSYLMNKFGITISDYDYMLKKQNNKCGICGKDASCFKSKLAVDHDHITGDIRGLLCFRCNFGLTYFSENADILSNAVKYLNNASDNNKEIINRVMSTTVDNLTKEEEILATYAYAKTSRVIIPDEIIEKIYQENKNGKSINQISKEYSWLCSRKCITLRLNQYKEKHEKQ